MILVINSKHFHITNHDKYKLTRKAEKLELLINRLQTRNKNLDLSIQVIRSKDLKRKSPIRFELDANILLSKKNISAHSHGKRFYTALNSLFKKLKVEAIKHKEFGLKSHLRFPRHQSIRYAG